MSDLIEREEAEAILWGLHWDTGESITVELKKLAALPASTRYAELERAARELRNEACEDLTVADKIEWIVSPGNMTALRTALANLDREQGNE